METDVIQAGALLIVIVAGFSGFQTPQFGRSFYIHSLIPSEDPIRIHFIGILVGFLDPLLRTTWCPALADSTSKFTSSGHHPNQLPNLLLADIIPFRYHLPSQPT
ncbi:hypothetical protein SDJN03_20566, partial [Cucurbita argyrosperma subsp. sororia]